MVHEHCEAEMSQAMGEIADTRVVAVDRSKFGRAALVALPALREGDVLVTDSAPPRRFGAVLAGLQVHDGRPRPAGRVYARPSGAAQGRGVG